jgi:outer membrane protein assembly factor BamB
MVMHVRMSGWSLLLVVLFVCGGLLLPAGAKAAGTASDEAVAYQIDVAHDGSLSGDVLAPPLVQQWSRSDLGGTVSYPLIAGGKVFVTVAGPYTSTSGSYPQKWIYALDENTGATIWSQSISGTYDFVNAAYDNGKVYVLNFDGLLQSFSADTGAPGWSVKLPGQYDFTSPPTAANGTVYAVGEGSGGTMYALDEANGALTWETSGLDTGGHSSPALSSSSAYVSGICDVYAFSLTPATSSPSPLWDKNYGCTGGGGKMPVLSSNGLYARNQGVPSSNDILDPATGALSGHFQAGPAPAFSGTTAFLLNSGALRAVDGSGDVLWSFAGDGGLDTAPIVVNSDVYVGSSSGMLYAVDTTTGTSAWSTNVGATIPAPDEQNATVLTGLGAGEGHLLVPAGTTLTAFVRKDTTVPVITPTVTGPQGANGWFTGPVNVTWSVTDPESGIASSSGCSATTLSSDTAGTTLTCTATNGAGLSSTASVTIKLDATAPTVSCTAPPSGWSASDVSVTCQAGDAVSGLASGTASSFSLSTSVPAGTETANASTPSATVCDAAGNCSLAGPFTGLLVDKKAPTIAVSAPAATTYTLNQAVAASYTCSDGGSGMATCAGSVPSGGPVATGSVGSKTFTVNATDAVHNSATPVTVTYQVTYGVCQASVPAIKSGRSGNVSVQLCDAGGANISSPAVTLTATGIYTSTGTRVRTLTTKFAFVSSLNTSGGGYTEPVSVSGLAPGFYFVGFTAAGDPAPHQAAFTVK